MGTDERPHQEQALIHPDRDDELLRPLSVDRCHSLRRRSGQLVRDMGTAFLLWNGGRLPKEPFFQIKPPAKLRPSLRGIVKHYRGVYLFDSV